MTNFYFTLRRLWSWPRRVFAALFAALMLSPVAAHAVDTLCAKVKIEITQELTLERQAFDAMMKINNGLTATSLDNVSVNVNFLDDAGNSIRATSDPTDTTAAFFIRIDTMAGIGNVTGTGVVAPSSTAEIHWLIIPAPGAGGTVPSGKLYYIGATLDYSVAGKAERVEVVPDFVYVKPMPLLALDYFMTRDVWGDDPLTLATEPPEPYTLGVRVKNNGAGPATNVKIDSAQPRIVDNNQGLLINFEIIGSYLNDQPAISSLLIPFGNIAPLAAATGRWIMTSSLAGYFADFSVSFTHADALGGALTSLLQATNPHYLVRDVKVDMPGRDTVRDFLADDGANGSHLYRVYESSGMDTLVTDQSAVSVLAANGVNASGEALFALSAPATAGPMYVQLADPYKGTKALGKITRSDGKTIPAENVWLSKKRDANNVLQYYFNLFDTDTTGIYNTAFTSTVVAAHPPVIQLVPDSTVVEGSQLSFQVTATDPDGTAPLLSASSLLPAGAAFTTAVGANNVVAGSFSWKPSKGQAGIYPVTFSATDGVLKAATSTNVAVTTPIVPAGPDVPLIAAPQVGTEVNVLSPGFEIAAGTNALDTAASYQIQVFSDAGMQNLVAEKLSLPRVAAGKSVWNLPVTLADNTSYYWRVRASDGTTSSPWAVGRFFVNTANDAPAAPMIASPAEGTTVAVTTPVLSVTNGTDPEGDAVVYGIEVFGDSLLAQKVAEVANLAAGSPGASNDGSTSWTVTPALSDTTPYYWRASATDVHGAKTVSATGNFLVDTSKPAPGAPALVSPPAGSTATINRTDLTVANSLRPNGMTLNYFFELDRSQSFASPGIIRSGAVAEGGVNTLFTTTGLVENAHYFWRVKSSDGLTESPWAYGNFFVDTINDAPGVPGAINPGNAAWVTTTAPLFALAPSVDPEGDAIGYHIEIYSDAALTAKVIDRLTNNLSWLTDAQLADDTRYYWRVRAEDMRGAASAWGPVSTFLVRTGSSGSMLPLLALTSPLSVVDVPQVSAATPGVAANISWEIDDPLSNSRIALYYDNDRLNADGARIIEGLPQDPGSRLGSYSWDVSALSPGAYYIYAVASNSAGTATRYAPGVFVAPVPAPRGVIAVTPATALETTEAGGLARFSVALGNSPKADVSIGISTTKPTEALVDKQQLVFNTANWKTPQVVTVAGQPDCINDGDAGYQVVTSKAISSDVDYNGIKGADLALLNRGSTTGCPSNNPPAAHAGPAQIVEAGSVVALIGGATDTDGSIVSYAWVQTAGAAVVLADTTGALTSFTAPLPTADTQLAFRLTVTDNLGATGTASVNVTVKKAPNQPPVATAGAAQTVNSGSTVNLSGAGADSDGTIASYSWAQIAGQQVTLAAASAANASFVAPAVTANTVLGFSLTVTDNMGATGTSTVAITVSPNQAPFADAGANQIVGEGSPVTLTGNGTDGDGSIVSYSWAQTGAPGVALTNANLATASFTAPAAATDTVLTFVLTVTDNLGATGAAATNVTVTHVNTAPAANAGANQSVNEGGAVTLNGSGADSDGTIVSYAWTQTAGPVVVLNGASTPTASFTAPATGVGTMLTFKLTVTDNAGATGAALTDVALNHVNLAPAANAGTNQTVDEGGAVTLSGSGADIDGTIASYAWTQTAGIAVTLAGANSATASFTAPPAAADTLLTFNLTVTDNAGATGAASSTVTVKHVNVAPTANAGVAQTANESTVVALNGGGTDSDGTVTSYAWTQTAGPPVTLSNASAATSSFIAPAAMIDTILSFKLVVTDNAGASGSATTSVTVTHVNAAPTVNAGADQTVNESSTVTLIGSGADGDGTIAAYAWSQAAGPAVTLAGANSATANFTAPAVAANTVFTFKLTVTDNLGTAAAATTNVTVTHTNVAPAANAGADQAVAEASTVTLAGSGTDSDGTIASHLWAQTAGPVVTLTGANTATASFVAPAVAASTVFTFKLTVADNLGATATATTNVTVQQVNAAPVANAGANQTVNDATTVTLAGSGSDSDGMIASYSWAQTAGPAVTLGNAIAATASFVAPVVASNTLFTFRLTVTDNLGATGSATTNVTVAHAGVAVAAPTSLAATPNATGTQLALAWIDNAGNETAYLVEVSTGGAFSTLATLARTTTQQTNIGGSVTYTATSTPGLVYTYRVTAVNVTGGVTSSSLPATAVADLSPPAAPSGLTAILVSSMTVNLAWIDNASTETNYVVEVSINGGAFATLTTIARTTAQQTSIGGAVTYTAEVEPGKTYSYRVKAQAIRFGSIAPSGYAGPVSISAAAPPAPANVGAVAGADAGSIKVSWTDTSSNESGFTVRRSQLTGTTWGAWGTAGTAAANITTITDTGRTTGISYRYQVRANSVAGNSAYVGPTNTVVAP